MRIIPALIDLALVIVFALIGRASHDRTPGFLGLLETAWPFLIACLLGWLVVTLLEDGGFGLRAAGVIWLVTVVGGLGLRILAGGGAAVPFILVAAGVLAAFLWGWRLVVWLVRRVRQSGASEAVPLS